MSFLQTKTVPQSILRTPVQSEVKTVSNTPPDMTSRSRPTSARPSSSKRPSFDQSFHQSNDNLEYECKAAYLVVFDSTEDNIVSRDQLIEGKFGETDCFLITCLLSFFLK